MLCREAKTREKLQRLSLNNSFQGLNHFDLTFGWKFGVAVLNFGCRLLPCTAEAGGCSPTPQTTVFCRPVWKWFSTLCINAVYCRSFLL